MEAIVLFDPAVGSLNIGDSVISASVDRQLADLLRHRFTIRLGTHTPIVTAYQNVGANPMIRTLDAARYKFIGGSNLLWKNLAVPRPSWNINPWNARPYRNSILIGVGTASKSQRTNIYSKRLYRSVLSSEFVHSVRDEVALEFVESLGLRAINTGCPTMWGFTDEFCRSIPTAKARNVVFTLTDYNKDPLRDQTLVDSLKRNFERVYFWPQGRGDGDYLRSLQGVSDIRVIPPTLKAYSEVLSRPDIEFIGTRLHAGMFAMQHRKRVLVLAIDERVRAIRRSFNIHSIERTDVDRLDALIEQDRTTAVNLDTAAIEAWRGQFEPSVSRTAELN